MEGIDRETQPLGRSVSVLVFGDTADEIELAALDEVRPFFGDGVILEVVREWEAFDTSGPVGQMPQAAGKKYYARVTVRTIEP
jgi:hypothetical protein